MSLDWTIHSFENLWSTQDTAKQYLDDGKHPLPFVVQADMQTSGRGRSGNQWVSIKGNLLTSIVIPLQNVNVRDAGQYSFLVAVAFVETLVGLGIQNVQNKWPNDVLVNGKKIAGILLESDVAADGMLNALIIGIGANLSHAPENAVCVQDITKAAITPLEFLNYFLKCLETQLLAMEQGGFAPIRKTWLSHAYGLGSEIRVRLPSETFYGEFIGLDDGGALLIKVADEDTYRIIHSGEVFFGQT